MHSSHIRCQRNDEHHEQAAINNPHTPGYVSMSHLRLSVVSLSRPVPLEPPPKVSGRCLESTATAPSPRFLPRLRLPSRLPPSAAGAGSAPRPSPAPPPQPSSKQQPQPCSGPTQGHVNLLSSRLRPRRGAGARARLRPRRLHGLSGRCVPPPPRSSRSAPARNVPAPAGGTLRRPRHPARVASALRQPPSVPARPPAAPGPALALCPLRPPCSQPRGIPARSREVFVQRRRAPCPSLCASAVLLPSPSPLGFMARGRASERHF